MWNIKVRIVSIVIGALSNQQQSGETPRGDPWQKQDSPTSKDSNTWQCTHLMKGAQSPQVQVG